MTLLAVAALASIGSVATTGCHDEPRHCVDALNHLQPDSVCEARPGTAFHYVYGGASGGHYGDTVVGASVSRGGFGGFGGEGGE